MNIIGYIIFNFIGATIRWIYGTIWRTVFNKKKFTFNEYLNGPNDSNDWHDKPGHKFVNKIIGIIFIIIIFILIIN